MKQFQLLNTNRYYLPAGNGKRFQHLATVTSASGLREYICFADHVTQQTYIEEITGGHLTTIDDDHLFHDLHDFLKEKGIIYVIDKNR